MMETRREEDGGGDYRRGGRWRLEERRKMAAITGWKEFVYLRRGGRWRPERKKMATIDEGIKIATKEGRNQRMSIGSAGRARGDCKGV